MRTRAGRVVLLMDRRAPAPIDRLTGASELACGLDCRMPATLGRASRSREIAWPSRCASRRLPSVRRTSARDSTRRAVVWSVPVGAGRLLVSGALDAWHYRDPATSKFDQFWTKTIAELTAGAPGAIDVDATRRSVAPGESVAVSVWISRRRCRRARIDRQTLSAALVHGTRHHDGPALAHGDARERSPVRSGRRGPGDVSDHRLVGHQHDDGADDRRSRRAHTGAR